MDEQDNPKACANCGLPLGDYPIGGICLACADAEDLSEEPLWGESRPLQPGDELKPIGEGLFRYRLTEKVGEGGMGEVWRAYDQVFGEEVALKLIKNATQMRPESLARFVQEARIGQKLKHENLATIRDIDFDNPHQVWFIAMDFVEGRNLQQWLIAREAPFSWDADFKGIVQQVLAGLAFAHKGVEIEEIDPLGKKVKRIKPIFHRDVKPANIMLRPDPTLRYQHRAVLMDFGIATPAGGAGGGFTPAYASPEQWADKSPAATQDIYSLGATLYELLTATKPIPGLTRDPASHQRVCTEMPVPLNQVRLAKGSPPVPEHVEQAVMRCLQKLPAARPASCRELESDLFQLKERGPWKLLVVLLLALGSAMFLADPIRRDVVQSRLHSLWPGLVPPVTKSRIVVLGDAGTPAQSVRLEQPDGGGLEPFSADESQAIFGPLAAGSYTIEAADGTRRGVAVGLRETNTVSLRRAMIVVHLPPRLERPVRLRVRGPEGERNWQTNQGPIRIAVESEGPYEIEATFPDGEVRATNAVLGARSPAWVVRWTERSTKLPIETDPVVVTVVEPPQPFDLVLLPDSGAPGIPVLKIAERGAHEARVPQGRYWLRVSQGTNVVSLTKLNATNGLPAVHPGWRRTKVTFPLEVADDLDAGQGRSELGVWLVCLDPFDQELARLKATSSRLVNSSRPTPNSKHRVHGELPSGTIRVRFELAPFGRQQFDVDLLGGETNFPPVRLARTLHPIPGWHHTNHLAFLWRPDARHWAGATEVPVGLYREFATQTRRTNSPVHAPGPSGWFVDPKRSWAAPGFVQEPSHPVTGVSRDDADAFAEWFTRKCRSEGYLLPEHSFRLPTRSEWLSWTGGREYPWGGSWPPGPDEGNYAGPEILGSPEWPAGWRILREPVPGQIRSAPDGYPTTAPAGAGSSVDGFVHLGGNVAEWCLDPYEPTMNRPADLAEDPRLAASNPGWGTVLGGSWLDGNDPPSLRSAFARPFARNQGAIWIGFRLVLVSSPGSSPSQPR